MSRCCTSAMSGISPPSIVRTAPGRTLLSPKPGASSGRYGTLVRLGRLSWGCEQIGWLPNPVTPMSPGGVCLDPHASGQAVPGTKQPPRDCIGQTRGSTWRGGASRGYEFPGYDHHGKASVSARKLGLKEGVGFNPRVNFDGESESESLAYCSGISPLAA